MSKLYKQYLDYKKEDNSIIYMFKSGLFYIFIGDDAYFVNERINLKLGYLNDKVRKCGFPIRSKDKYMKLLEDFKIKEVDNNFENNINKKKLDFIINDLKELRNRI